MRKAVIIGIAVAAAAVAGRLFSSKVNKIDFEQKIAKMPDMSPRKWMFTNISAIRANTDRILELLDERAPVARWESPPSLEHGAVPDA